MYTCQHEYLEYITNADLQTIDLSEIYGFFHLWGRSLIRRLVCHEEAIVVCWLIYIWQIDISSSKVIIYHHLASKIIICPLSSNLITIYSYLPINQLSISILPLLRRVALHKHSFHEITTRGIYLCRFRWSCSN